MRCDNRRTNCNSNGNSGTKVSHSSSDADTDRSANRYTCTNVFHSTASSKI